MPIIINSPPVNIPKSLSPKKDVGHIIFSPTIIYPDKKKRIVVHHNSSFQDYYKKMTMNLNPFYLGMAKMNPYYQQYLSGAPFYSNMMSNPKYSKYLMKAESVMDKGGYSPTGV